MRLLRPISAPSDDACYIPGIGIIPFPPGHVDLDHATATSGALGGQIGCRWENAEHWVFGVEGDFDWTNLHATVINTAPATTGIFPGDTFDNRMRWESSARITLGRSFDRWLVYGTGGIAFGRVDMSANFIPVVVNGVPFPGAVGSDSKTLVGGTVGLGTAYIHFLRPVRLQSGNAFRVLRFHHRSPGARPGVCQHDRHGAQGPGDPGGAVQAQLPLRLGRTGGRKILSANV